MTLIRIMRLIYPGVDFTTRPTNTDTNADMDAEIGMNLPWDFPTRLTNTDDDTTPDTQS
jgi:hypothetical protein